MKEREQLAYSPENFGQLIDRKRSFIYGHIRAGNIKTIQMGDGKRIPRAEAERILREGLPPLTKKQPA